MLSDTRVAIRRLLLCPWFTTSSVLMLALGIGSTTAIFSISEAVLLRPLPFSAPSRLVVLSDVLNQMNVTDGSAGVTAPEIQKYIRDTGSFEHLGGYLVTSYEVSDPSEPVRLKGARMTSGVFPALGVAPLYGRVFSQNEEDAKQRVVVLSYTAWHTYCHGDPKAIGETLNLNRTPYTIIGIMPRQFEFPLLAGQGGGAQFWVPMSFTAEELQGANAAAWGFHMVGRLDPKVTLAQAQNDAQRAAALIMNDYPSFMRSIHIAASVQPLETITVSQIQPVLRALFLAVSCVMLIACANLTGLLLVRAIGRKREIGIRLALGAQLRAILRETVIESLLLSLTGSLLGLLLAILAVSAGKGLLPETIPRINEIGLDWNVVLFALASAILAGILCGLAPALSAIRVDVNNALKDGGRAGTVTREHLRLRSTVVIAEIAIAFVLVNSSGLLLCSFEKMQAVEMGFNPDHVLAASYSLPREQYASQSSVDRFSSELLRRLKSLPGVRAAALASMLPASGMEILSNFVAEGHANANSASSDLAWSSSVAGDYFDAMGIPLLAGRLFTEEDNDNSQLVVIVNHKLATSYWPNQSPIGKRLRWGMPETPTPWMTVIGEVGDIKQGRRDQDTRLQTYQPFSQEAASLGTLASSADLSATRATIILRTGIPTERITHALTAIVHSIDPLLPLTHVETLNRTISEGDAPRRFFTGLITSFAITALLLVLSGIYSVIAYSTAQGSQEVAIRIAVGAQRSDIRRRVLLSAAKLVSIGCLIGLVGTSIATRLLQSFLFAANRFQSATQIISAIIILVLSSAVSLAPAWRAASIDPAKVLKGQ